MQKSTYDILPFVLEKEKVNTRRNTSKGFIHLKDKPKTNKISHLQGVETEWKEGKEQNKKDKGKFKYIFLYNSDF